MLREVVTDIFTAAVQAVDPYRLVQPHIETIRDLYWRYSLKKLFVISIGKSACQMTTALEDALSELIVSGVVITKYGHCVPFSEKTKIERFEAGHPVPDENGIKATEKILHLLSKADEATLVVCLISGGGSALCVAPYDGIRLDEKQKVTDLLLRGGAAIDELNAVRKHISRVKGGRLAELAYPARTVSLILSDVVGDKPDVIASGPTAPDPTTFDDALAALDRYMLMDKTPQSVLEVIYRGAAGYWPETPKQGDKTFERVENVIIGNNRTALEGARLKAEASGFGVEILSADLTGDAVEVGRALAQKVRKIKAFPRAYRPLCLLSSGETTVKVRGSGRGGRNMELALAFAMEIAGEPDITLLSAGTDGTDGPTDAAGAIVDGTTIMQAQALGIDPEAYLCNNDSYTFFKKIGGLFITGPTGTNVMDIQIIIISSQ
ncbi:MAG: glycerate kinase type-2 family protein [Nitrospirota bacterium]